MLICFRFTCNVINPTLVTYPLHINYVQTMRNCACRFVDYVLRLFTCRQMSNKIK